MRSHIVHQFFPKLLAGLLVPPHVAYHGVFMGALRDKNQDRIASPRFLHSQLKKSSLCPRQSIILEFSPLNKNTNLAGTFPLRLFNRLGYPIVIEAAKKMMRPHLCYQLPLAPPPLLDPPSPMNPLNPQPPDDPPPPRPQSPSIHRPTTP